MNVKPDSVISQILYLISIQKAADLLAKLLTVDGTGSGLDADKLDGHDSTYFTPAGIVITTTTPIQIDGGTSADLSASRTISIIPSTITASGSMSAVDKTKLDSVTSGAAVASVSGTIPIESSGGTNPIISITPSTVIASGSMSAVDKTKLDSMTSGAAVASVSATSPLQSSGGTTPTISIMASTGTGTAFVLSVSPTLTGTPLAPTPVVGTTTTQIATAEMIDAMTPSCGGDGVTVTFLHDGTKAIYRKDWQGAQLLYSTSRTNYLLYSKAQNNASYLLTTATIGAGITDPSGGTDAFTLTSTAANGSISCSAAMAVPPGTYTNSLWIKRRTGTGVVNILHPAGVSWANPIIITASWARYSITSADTAGFTNWGLQLVTIGDAVDIAFGQCEPGSTVGSFILTTATSASVTDYTTAGGMAIFAAAPIATSVIYGVSDKQALELGEAYYYTPTGSPATSMAIDTTLLYHGLVVATTAGVGISGFTHKVGQANNIASVAEDSAGVSYKVTTTGAHNLVSGEIITHTGFSTRVTYRGALVVQSTPSATEYIVLGTYLGTDTGFMKRAFSLRANVGASGIYRTSFSLTAQAAVATTDFKMEINKNITPLDNIAAQNEFQNAGRPNTISHPGGFVILVDGDYIWLSVANLTDGSDIELMHVNMSINRI